MAHASKSRQAAMKTRSKPPVSVKAALEEAVEYLDQLFDQGENVDGGDLVEWMAEWRVRAREALERSNHAS